MPDIPYPVGGGTIPGYLATPQGPPGPWPGVVVIHEAFGLSDHVRRKADEFAARGYLALAPDLFEGKPWFRCVRAAIQQLRAQSGRAFTVLEAARAFLAGRADCTGRTGVAGFCLGGGYALLCAPREGFAVASVNYGEVPEDAERVLAGSCPIVGSFGGRDPMGTKHPERLQRALTVLEIPHDVEVYPGSGHRFMSEATGAGAVLAKTARMSYQRADAEDSWRRIFAFFDRYLGDGATGTQAGPGAGRPSSGS